MSAVAPKEVKRLSEEADRLHKELFGEKDGEQKAPPEEPAGQEEPDKQEKPPLAATANTGPEQGEPQGSSETEQDKPESSPVQQDEATWEHKYKTLQGIHRSKMARADDTIQSLTDELNQLKNRLDTLETNSPKAQAGPTTSTKLLNDDEIEDYGEDLISVIKRAAREELLAEFESIKQENRQLKELVGGVTSTVRNNAKKDLYSQLGKAVPNWKELNHSEEFLYWLEQPDAYSGEQRQNLLTQAFEKGDVSRVINFFNGFINEQDAVQQQEPSPVTRKPAVNMSDMVAPGKPRYDTAVAQTGTHRDERVWTQNEIQDFYDKSRKGFYRTRPEEKARIESEIIRAVNENRVR